MKPACSFVIVCIALSGFAGSAPAQSAARDPAEAVFARAAALTGRGDDAASAQILKSLLRQRDSAMERRVRLLLMTNERALFRYREALLAILPLGDGSHGDIANQKRLLEALANVPSQAVEAGGEVRLAGVAFTAQLGRQRVRMLLDTGASFCATSRKIATMAGLQIRKTGYRIRTALGGEIIADLAIADLRIAGRRIRNVVFLILPDAALQGRPASALLGLPVLRQLVVALGNSGGDHPSVFIPLVYARGSLAVDALVESTPVRCELDTGSDRSWFAASHLPFHALNRRTLSARSITVSGVSGRDRVVHPYRFAARISLGGTRFVVPAALAMPARFSGAAGFACTLGWDALRRLSPVRINLGAMRLSLQ